MSLTHVYTCCTISQNELSASKIAEARPSSSTTERQMSNRELNGLDHSQTFPDHIGTLQYKVPGIGVPGTSSLDHRLAVLPFIMKKKHSKHNHHMVVCTLT